MLISASHENFNKLWPKTDGIIVKLLIPYIFSTIFISGGLRVFNVPVNPIIYLNCFGISAYEKLPQLIPI